MFGRLVKRMAGAAVAAAAAIAVQAAPADDHRLALESFQRGDVVAAMRALRAPAEAGYTPSQVLLAFILDRADAVEEAVRWYRAAAQQGDVEAHAALGSFYATGRGVAKDEKQAFVHFSKAADGGNSLAIQVVADTYLKGAASVDVAAAAAALKRAAERGHLPSAEALAQAYRTGGRFGLPADAAQADRWQARVAELRRPPAAQAPKKSP